jgi:tetratricopeptide (TPR) repeat protein
MTRPLIVGALIAGLAVGAALTWNAATRDREYQRLVAAGDAALAGDQTFLAIESYSGAIALKRDSMLAYLRRGETYRQRGDLEAALRDLRTASSIDPAAPRPLEQLGDVQYALKRYHRAAERYAAYIRLDDRSPRVLYKLALTRFTGGDAGAAIPPLRQAVHLNERFVEANYLLGLALWRTEQPREAIAALQRTVRIAPAFAPAREALADCFASQNRLGDQIQQLEALATNEPERTDRYLALGLAHAARGRHDLAVAAIGRAIERAPNDRRAYSALTRVWLDVAEAHGDRVALDKAQRALRLALADRAPTADDLALQGRVLLLRGDAAGAFRVLRDAVTRGPAEPSTFLRLADAAARLDRKDDERLALRQYAALAPGAERSRGAGAHLARVQMQR